MSRVRPTDAGFTLTEVLMAMLVMSIAVAAIVEGLTTMIGLGREHRGHAVMEAATRSVAASTVAVAVGTTLAAEVSTTGTTLSVIDASLLPPPVAEGTYATLGHEIVKIVTRDTTTNAVTVTRRHNGEAVTSAPAGTRVAPVLRCPTAPQLLPTIAATGLPDGTSVQVIGVDYWKPDVTIVAGVARGSYVNRSDCLAAYEVKCPPPEVLVECGIGLFRANVQATTTDARLNGKTEHTAVLVRQGPR